MASLGVLVVLTADEANAGRRLNPAELRPQRPLIVGPPEHQRVEAPQRPQVGHHGRVERGRHEQLIRRDGLYRQIYDLELRDQEEALEKVRREETEKAAASAAGEGVKG